MRSHYLFYFLFFMHFILRVSLLTASPSLLSSSTNLLSITDLTSPTADPFLHRQSHKLPTLFSIVDLTSSAATNPSLHRQSHKLSCHKPFSPSPISQAQLPQTLPFRFALILFRSRRTKPRRWRRNRAVSIS